MNLARPIGFEIFRRLDPPHHQRASASASASTSFKISLGFFSPGSSAPTPLDDVGLMRGRLIIASRFAIHRWIDKWDVDENQRRGQATPRDGNSRDEKTRPLGPGELSDRRSSDHGLATIGAEGSKLK
jgi:hypothetical protein